MSDNEVTGATARPWSYDIQHGPNGEEIYAWVYYYDLMVCTVKAHHAKMIVEAVNNHDRLTAENAELRTNWLAEVGRADRWLAEAEIAQDVVMDIANELNCENDNKAILAAIASLTERTLAAEARMDVEELK